MAFVSDVMTPSIEISYPQRFARDISKAKIDDRDLSNGVGDQLVSAIADPDDIKYCASKNDLVHFVDNLGGREAWLLCIAASVSQVLRAPFTRRKRSRPEVQPRKRAEQPQITGYRQAA